MFLAGRAVALGALLLLSQALADARQSPFLSSHPNPYAQVVEDKNLYFNFTAATNGTGVRRVAVIGAGPGGLIHASTLIEQGFEVRLFERASRPGGQWFYTDKKPVHASFPNRPIAISGYVPDVPDKLPRTRIYKDGEDGVSNDYRLREHWNPSSVWNGLTSTVPPFMMDFPGITHSPDTPWLMPNRVVQRHVRQYASFRGLNSNDDEAANITSYSTRVERVVKPAGSYQWVLTLRKIAPVEGSTDLRADWWEERFDAVVVGTDSEADSPFVPNIPGLNEWAHAFPESVYHVREYRRPEAVAGKNVMIIGGSISASGVATDMHKHTKSVMASIRLHPNQPPSWDATFMGLFPENMTFVPEVDHFSSLSLATKQKGSSIGAQDIKLTLKNGTVLTGFDHIILATGYRYSFPFLHGLHNDTIKGFDEPETKIAPVITDGTHRRSLHWTGHYIADPTLAFASYEPWELGPYQALGFAKTWDGKANLPNVDEMWSTYPGAGRELSCKPGQTDFCHRLFVTWLNDANLQYGGRMVDPLSRKDLEGNTYFLKKFLKNPNVDLVASRKIKDNMPQSDWPVRNHTRRTVPLPDGLQLRGDQGLVEEEWSHWADLTDRW